MVLRLIFIVFSGLLSLASYSQCAGLSEFNSRIDKVEPENYGDRPKIISLLRRIKSEFEGCKLEKDSVYAKLLHKIGILDYQEHNFIASEENIEYTKQAIRINLSGKKGSYPAYTTKSYYNLAALYQSVDRYQDALKYQDSAIFYATKYPDFRNFFLVDARYRKALLQFDLGDYQASADGLTLAIRDDIQSGNSGRLVELYSKRAEANQFQDNFIEARKDADLAINRGIEELSIYKGETETIAGIYDQLATATKIRATSVSEPSAINEFRKNADKAIEYRKKSGQLNKLSVDYIDLGANYFNKFHDSYLAKQMYLNAIRYAERDTSNLAFAYLNLGAAEFPLGQYDEAEQHYLKMLQLAGMPASSILETQSLKKLLSIQYTNLVQVYLNNKTELLLGIFNRTKDKKYLDAAISNSMLNDQFIRQVRIEQSGEISKLYWRKRTRSFFTNALEACFLAKDYAHAFYFMEKSRAVLLADKLNELGANSQLPTIETIRERQLRERISALELNSKSLNTSDPSYDSAREDLVAARDELSAHIKMLEQNYPGYFRYKYSDSILSLAEFSGFLKANQQGFIHYFIGDSVSFALAINGDNIKMIRVDGEEYPGNAISKLAAYFADKGYQNSKYAEFSNAAHYFYRYLFAPLGMTLKNVIICADGFALPFDALCEDAQGRNFLLGKFGFSYVYSAASLMSKPPVAKAAGNFIGFAPVSFKPYLSLASLTPSAGSLDQAAENYTHSALFVNDRATRENFLTNIGNYRIVNIFSHASAGTDDTEPVLFMQDSVIHLSELQYLPTQAARLVILSACQTSSGKNQLGEGIYSLSRGFAAAGIPTVMATIWKADEQAVYKISVSFNRYIAQGMRQDEALQKAKLEYLQTATKEQSLPYYWSNIVLMGSADPIVLDQGFTFPAWIRGIALLTVLGLTLFFLKRRRSKN